MKITLPGGSWDGSGYSPTTQESIFPFIAAAFETGCCAGDRTVVGSSVTNTGEDDAFLQLRDGAADGVLVSSHILPAGQTTNFQFPVKLNGKPWVVISSTPFTATPVGNFAEFGGHFWTR